MKIRQRVVQFWSARAPRERQLLALGAGFLALTVGWLICVQPASTGIARLERLLPQTRAQAAQLEALVVEARALRAHPAAAVSGSGDLRAAIDKSLAGTGMAAERRETAANGDLRLHFTNVSYAAWTGWLAMSEQNLGLRAVAVQVQATATPGNADIDVSLRGPHS